MYDKKRWNRGGDHSETQWYCPPDVGALWRFVSKMHLCNLFIKGGKGRLTWKPSQQSTSTRKRIQ